MLLIHLGSPEEGERFFSARWPEARAVSDQNKELYTAFGLGRGSPAQLLGPKVWLAGLKAVVSGHGVGKPVGDPTMMSAWFLVRDGVALWQQVHEHTGEARRYEELEAAYRGARHAT